jgi:hypothetical protein
LIGVDDTYMGLRFQMTLLIAIYIDANDETLLMAWALVPMELEV